MTENKCGIGISSIFDTVFRYLPIFLTVLRYWVAWRCSPIKVRWPLRALTRNVRWNVCNEIHAAHIQSIWSEAEFIIINWNNIKLFHFTISGDRKIFFFYLYFTHLLAFRSSLGRWTLSRDNISKVQLSLADGNFELFSFSAYFSSSFLF